VLWLFKVGDVPADLFEMGRSAGIVTLVISLVAGAVLFAVQWSGTSSPATPKTGRSAPVDHANAVAAQATQALAERELAAFQASTGSFEGAQVAGVPGVTVRSAGATSYCLQIASSGGVFYDAGPGGTLSQLPC
jgi:hypothetical protein